MDEIARGLCGLGINYSHLIRVTLHSERFIFNLESKVAARHARSAADTPRAVVTCCLGFHDA